MVYIMVRLPTPGADEGQWGQILNDFLMRAHETDGALKENSVTAAAIAPNTIAEENLTPAVQAKLNTVAGQQGATGPQGATGASGPAGAHGATGAAGPQGSSGAAGSQGATGASGTPGIAGATGPQGAAGTAGATGASGPAGVAGSNGATGATGPQGTSGPVGASGTPGTQGATGASGPAGSAGIAGATGATGPAGATGPQGASGPVGSAGIVVLAAGDPDPSPVVDGVLYIRLTGDIVDTTAPSVPANFTTGGITSSSIQLTWSASTDNVGVTGYQVRRDGGSPVSLTGTSYTYTGLSANTEYSFEVRAGDAAGLWSAWSSTIQASTVTSGGVVFSDDFNRANGQAGNGWDSGAGTGGVNIESNALAVSGWGGYGWAWQGDLPKAISVRATFTGTLDIWQGIFLGRTAAQGGGIRLFNAGGTWVIGTANTHSDGADVGVSYVNTPSTPYTSLRLDFDGTNITAYINGVIVHTTTIGSLGLTLDTDPGNVYRAGYCGEARGPYMDTFEVYAI